MNSVRKANLSLKYQRFTSPSCKDIWIRILVFVTKTQFRYLQKAVKATVSVIKSDFSCKEDNAQFTTVTF